MVDPVVVVHGGCGTVPPGLREAAVRGVIEAAQAAQSTWRRGGDCEDAAVAAVRVLEDDPTFNAGRGSCMNAVGGFQHDAALMRSRDLRSGAVAAVPEIRDPIVVARLVLEHTPHCLLVGEGAVALARKHGVGTFGREEVWTAKAQAAFDAAVAGRTAADGRADTVGAVVLDPAGNLCAAGSTGGVLLKQPGRVGDTPLVGGGLYAHPQWGAACATGMGEAILTHVMCYEVLRRIRDGVEPRLAASALCREVATVQRATCGLIIVTPDGRPALAHASPHMSWAMAQGDLEPHGGLGSPT